MYKKQSEMPKVENLKSKMPKAKCWNLNPKQQKLKSKLEMPNVEMADKDKFKMLKTESENQNAESLKGREMLRAES